MPVTRPASVVAFVCGLVVFVPFVTQVIAVLVGLVAISRPRKPHERVVLAWWGLVLGVLMFPAWILLITWFMSSISAAPGLVWGPLPPPAADAELWGEAVALQAQMEQIHEAAAAYQRDYRRWPAHVDALVGLSLPRSFVMSEKLTFRPVPPSRSFFNAWVLIVSTPVQYDFDGEPLTEPEQLVLRLSGRIELLSVETVDKLLAAQSQGGHATETMQSPAQGADQP